MDRANVRYGRAGRQGSAFTLIELLVVVAITALLVSILVPSLKKARDLAKTAICASNQKQVGWTMQIYLADYNGTFFGPYAPRSHDYDARTFVLMLLDIAVGEHPYETWRHVTNFSAADLHPANDQPAPWGADLQAGTNNYNAYRRDAGIFFCPSAPMTTMLVPATWAGAGAIEAESTTYHAPIYTWSYYSTAPDPINAYSTPCKLAGIKKPSGSVMLGEGFFHLWPVLDGDWFMANLLPPGGIWPEDTRYSHDGQINFLYFDGHAGLDVTAPYSFDGGGANCYSNFVD